MKNLTAIIVAALTILLLPYLAYSQKAQAPKYKDGDWWRVKAKVVQKGYSRSGRCDENYAEYLVKWEKGKPTVYGVSGKNEEEIDCPSIIRDLLNIPPDELGWLNFPLSVGKDWSFRYLSSFTGGWRYSENQVTAWEKVRTPKGEFDAFKIDREVGRTNYYLWYSPAAKAIIVIQRRSINSDRTATLVDYNVSK